MASEIEMTGEVSAQDTAFGADDFGLEIVEIEGSEVEADGDTVFYRSTTTCTCTC